MKEREEWLNTHQSSAFAMRGYQGEFEQMQEWTITIPACETWDEYEDALINALYSWWKDDYPLRDII